MARFARDILYKMGELTKKLELSLGPDTVDLALKVGLHSGPVTGGVLRGDKARFQLFGDTMNTGTKSNKKRFFQLLPRTELIHSFSTPAARIESTGNPNCVHLSQETAELLIAKGKSRWVKMRDGTVYAKGKGKFNLTFFS